MKGKTHLSATKRLLLYAISLLIIGYYAVVLTYEKHHLDGAIYFMENIGIMLALMMLLYAYRKDQQRNRLYLSLLFIGTFSYLVGNMMVVFGAGDSLLAQALYTVLTVLYPVAFIHKLFKVRRERVVYFLLDLFITISVVTTLFWHFYFFPLYETGKLNSPMLLLTEIYQIGDIGLLFTYLTMRGYLGKHFSKVGQAFLFLGILLYLAADIHYFYMGVVMDYSSIFQPLWAAGILFIAYSTLFQDRDIPVQEKSVYMQTKWLSQFFPYAGLLLLMGSIAFQLDSARTLLVGTSLTVFLLVIRHLLTLSLNNKLISRLHFMNENLESEVYHRTRELQTRNKELSDAVKTIKEMAYTDTLTKLPNRDCFEEDLTRYVNGTRQAFAVLFLDLNRFKIVNDTLGHHKGDKLLVKVAERLKHAVGERGKAYRFGGDEFIVNLDTGSKQETEQFVLFLLEELSPPYFIEENVFYIIPSIGVSLYPEDGTDPSTLIKHADSAMYHVKRNKEGELYKFYDGKLSSSIESMLYLERELNIAIKNDMFKLVYQPQFETDTAKMVSAEALIRWEHPERGTISPAEFIPAAEETGLIIPIGKWVIREVCKQQREWIDNGIGPVKVAVNLSPKQLFSETIVDVVVDAIQEYRVDPAYLELEITEDFYITNLETIRNNIIKLSELGVTIAVDDFGTGYSSLHYLKHFPINRLKIDRFFISSMDMDDEKAIVEAIIHMAKSLDMSVVAEGVETNHQLELLNEMQCAFIQGYLLSKPLEVADLENKYLGRGACHSPEFVESQSVHT